MNIILVSNRFAKTRSLTLKLPHLLLAASLSFCILLAAAIAAQYMLIRTQPDTFIPEIRNWLADVQPEVSEQTQVRDSLDAMAKRLGQMQSQLLRLDALGTRLAKLNGIKPQEIDFAQDTGMGGPFIPAPAIDIEGLQQRMEELSVLLKDRSDKLAALETLQMQNSLDKKLFPSGIPIKDAHMSSGFGWRIDPITGKQALHEGLDFSAPVGTPILSSAGGIVLYAGRHPQYGNMVEIDHGNGVITRYGHASRLLVKVGQMVKRGQKIAEVGNTGRSTGSHLHFEVRFKGHAQNPRSILKTAMG